MYQGDVERLHRPFDDPAAVEGAEEVRKSGFRHIRRIMLFLDGTESIR